MRNPRLATRYAKSLLDLAQEQNVLEPVLKDMNMLTELCSKSPDFTLMLRSPVIKGDKKRAVLKAIIGDKVQPVTEGFITLLVKKGREFFLPEMAAAYVTQYKTLKKIHTVQFTTAVKIDETLKQEILGKITASVKEGTIDLQMDVNEHLVGGFTLEVGDKLFDASIRRDLNDIKKQFTKNLYVADI
jgi:F-type H+-transporting ATPase subunit delta